MCGAAEAGQVRTSSELAVCRSTARLNSSSSRGNRPSPLRQPCRHANSFKYSFASLHSPALTFSSVSAAAFARTSPAISGFSVLTARTTAATKGVLSGCSRAIWSVRLTKVLRSSSLSSLSAITCASDCTSSGHRRRGDSASVRSCFRILTGSGAESMRRRGPRRS